MYVMNVIKREELQKYFKSKKNIIILILLIWGVVTIGLKFIVNGDIFSKICVLSSTLFFIFELYLIIKETKMIFHPVIIFLLSLYFFQTGQLLLYSLNVEFDMKYMESLIQLLPNATMYICFGNVIAGYAGVLASSKEHRTNCFLNSLYEEDSNFFEKVILLAFFIAFMVYVPTVIYEFFKYGLHGGRFLVRAFEDSMSYYQVFALSRTLFSPLGVLFIVFSENRNKKRIVAGIVCLGLIFDMLCGNRTAGATGLLALMLLPYISTENSEKRRKYTMYLIIAGLVLVGMIVFVSEFRINGIENTKFGNPFSILVDFISELGVSGFTVFTAMYIVPHFEGFLFGVQYVQSFLCGIIPSVLDVTGIVERLTSDWYIFQEWMDKYFDFSFSFASSLNTESYINFGWLGLVALFVIYYFVFSHLCPQRYVGGKLNKYGIYKMVILINMWILLPRGQSISIWIAFLWGIIFVNIYVKGMYILRNILVNIRRKYEK